MNDAITDISPKTKLFNEKHIAALICHNVTIVNVSVIFSSKFYF